MVDSELKRLIELNEKIVKQNDRIIELLSKLTGENEKSADNNLDVVIGENGNVLIGENLTEHIDDDAPKEIEQDSDKKPLFDVNENAVLNSQLNSGEVMFVSSSSDDEVDIFKLSITPSDEFNVIPSQFRSEIEDEIGIVNNKIVIENLTGDGQTNQFKVPLLVAFESFSRNIPIDSNRVILDDVHFENLPDILKIAMENGAQKVHLSLKNAMATLNAPPAIVEYLEFYKNPDQIFDKIF